MICSDIDAGVCLFCKGFFNAPNGKCACTTTGQTLTSIAGAQTDCEALPVTDAAVPTNNLEGEWEKYALRFVKNTNNDATKLATLINAQITAFTFLYNGGGSYNSGNFSAKFVSSTDKVVKQRNKVLANVLAIYGSSTLLTPTVISNI